MKKLTQFSAMFLATSIAFSSFSDDRFADAKVETVHVKGNIHMLTGPGGNIGVTVGEDGTLIIDDKYAPLGDKIEQALATLSDAKLRYVINTHYHGDHTGSNAHMHDKGATIFAHHNVRKRLANNQELTKADLPVVTYADGIKIHVNGDTLDIKHLPTGHTDGDSWIVFESANVVHTGDLFFKDRFPYIDKGAGGTVEGYINNVEMMLSHIDDSTKIIPGHGSLANKAELQAFVDMIKATNQEVQQRKSQGESVDEIIASGLDKKWASWSWQFITEEKWIKTLF
ncbi:MBL fold metallo-hydrolase [Aestuariibacter sp. AA17]|uniref:MBL fold metallo-hydrolase n=1 Tax=Fluctibacter corallii TaxID=2984329 RepID=A0ABT3A7T8_9ALTE|nr:MBL fold metallo-hydrolase [Aestuariibacter sp. AA17]MCV2884668.1 MBL fold metallo-hydrolase [Aestuariibacter sp. AA17]